MNRPHSLRVGVAVLCVLCVSSFPSLASSQSLPHDRQFWRDIAKNHYAVPPGHSAAVLATELSANLASTDSELRDDLAYSILYVWIVRQNQLTAPELVSLLNQWQSSLRIRIGETGTDAIFRRSFSALCLVSIAERELKTPFMGESRYRTLLANALTYLNDERDLRGFDPVKGWIHATAHTADLLAALAASPLFRVEDQPQVLNAISERLSSAHEIFAYGEQDRLAATIAAIIERKDFDTDAFRKWLAALNDSDRKVWSDSPPNADRLKVYQNNNYMLQALAARLAAEPKSTAAAAVEAQLSEVLRKR